MPKRIITSDRIHKGRLPFAQATVAGGFMFVCCVGTDKDGKLSRIEVDEKMPRLAKRFAWMDDNRDGFLSRAELEPRRHR